MADYAMRLAAWSEANETDMESFYSFNNAVLQVKEGTSLGKITLHTNYAEKYLLKLSTGTKSILESEALLLAMGEENLRERNKRLMTRANLWSSQYIVFKEYTGANELHS